MKYAPRSHKKHFLFRAASLGLALLLALPAQLLADVCGEGLGEPPFLSFGVKPNVLLMVDNSGSMLDLAYIDESDDGGQCMDNTYDSAKEYAGLFDPEVWYKWVESTPQWTSGETYSVNDFVYSEGVFFRATAVAGASIGTRITEDSNVTWARVHEIPLWAPGTVYPAKSFVQEGEQLYYTAAGGTANDPDSSDGISIDGDTGVTWVKKDSTWINGNAYAKYDVVSAAGMLFSADAAGTANGTGPWDDTGVTWSRLDEGSFQAVSTWTSSASPQTAFAGLPGTFYKQDDLYVKITSVGGVESGVSAFAATGNFLNWASASKFDIQKNILTGGKYHPDEEHLVGQGRGCSGRGFVKEVAVLDSGGASRVITLSIEGYKQDSWIDTTDDTTRIVIKGISAEGFVDSDRAQACQDAIDSITSGYDDGQGTTKQNVTDCLDYGGTNNIMAESNSAYNHSLHACWEMITKDYDAPADFGNVSEVQASCEHIYNLDMPPQTITYDQSGYLCFGIYNAAIPDARTPTGTGSDRIGYVGRCWKLGSLPAGCKTVSCPAGTPYDTGNPRCFQDNLYYTCTGSFNAKQDSCNKPWALKLEDADPDDGITCNTSALADPGGWAADTDLNPNNTQECIQEALWDYCGGLQVPEVIDPTDETVQTGTTLGMVGALIDSGVANMFGTDHALLVMKGYVKVDEAPEGLIQKYAEDMRLGAMRFNDNGAATECEDKGDDSTDPISYDCPAGNQDGARIISEIGLGDDHTAELVEAINDVQANAWTPLAEAMYTAIGYFTQNDAYKCQDTDFTVGDDPVQFYCQDNHVVIITDGASTADLHSGMQSLATDAVKIPDTIDPTDDATCDDLFSSSYFDNLTAFAYQATAEDLYPDGKSQIDSEDKQTVQTHIVVSGTVRDNGEDDECNPKNLMTNAAANSDTELLTSATPDQLRANLQKVLESIRKGASAGSAASVISSSRGGEGAIFQAIFWPKLRVPSDPTNKDKELRWAGEVHSLFVDSTGYLYEDSDGDRVLNTSLDKRVVVYFDEGANESKGCYGGLESDGSCAAENQVALDAVKYLWSANNWLAGITDADIVANRATYLSNSKRRYIFTWQDKNNDGIVDSGETLPFVASTDWAASTGISADRSSMATDFNVDPDGAAPDAKVDAIVDWVRGKDQVGLRSRLMDKGLNDDGTVKEPFTWRLGDVIHSTPTAVGAPAENLHLLYNDTSYGKFLARWKKRRQMAYFGGNDGMLHAVNAGFYNETLRKFCLTGSCLEADEAVAPALGAELWAYVPYNLLPHLKCLTNPNYEHKYYVDQRPRVFDAKIFTPEPQCLVSHTDPGCIHPEGWGTVLVGAMRFGGAPVNADDLPGAEATENRRFTSAYFLLDITNPEAPPALLGELTARDDGTTTELGFTTAIVTPVVMKDDASSANDWYLVMGSGPQAALTGNAMKGVSEQQPKLAILPLKELADKSKPFRILEAEPVSGTDSGRYLLAGSGNGFVSDLISVDYDLNKNYKTDAVYFGTVEGSTGAWSGKLYRLVTQDVIAGQQMVTKPFEWKDLTPSASGVIQPMFNPGQPITAAPAVGTDGYNYWVYFGTGRFFHADDKTDASQQSFYGIKELLNCDGSFPWLANVSKAPSGTALGQRGLVDASNILVTSSVALTAPLSCEGGGTGCLPNSGAVDTFVELIDWTAGRGCVDTDADEIPETPTGKDGWYRNFSITERPRERNVGQATLLGGLLTFTTYQPFDSVCKQEGLAYLYGLYYQTGTPWYRPVFGTELGLSGDYVEGSISLGLGLATTPNLHVGAGEGGKGPTAFVQTSTGEIVEVPQQDLPYQNFKSGRTSWEELIR